MNIAIVGFAVENQAVYRYWKDRGATLTICDQDATVQIPEGVASQLGDKYLDNLGRFDMIVRTVGMHPKAILDHNPGVEPKITTAIDIFMADCHKPVIGVTGTKGKGTTSTLITKILEAAGKKVLLGGNIGIPALDLLPQVPDADFVVLELSSFQLYDAKHSPHVAICLMVVPEHLNWHDSMDDYKHAKSNMFRYQNSDDVAVYNALNQNSREIAGTSPAATKLSYAVPETTEKTSNIGVATFVKDHQIFYHDTPICMIEDVGLIGRHNLENICAAITATWQLIDGDLNAIKKVVTSFSGLEHRLEFVKQIAGVRYFNDSFSTTPETAIAAIKAFEEPKIVILGGDDKGIPFDSLADAVVRNDVKHVIAIGKMGPVIAELLRKRGYNDITETGKAPMTEIAATAQKLAAAGDVVVLSTGCASFDMFKNYKVRGDQFKAAVNALPDKR